MIASDYDFLVLSKNSCYVLTFRAGRPTGKNTCTLYG